MTCHPESKKSRTKTCHSMREEIQLGLGVTQETTTLSSVSIVLYFRRYFNFYRGVLHYLKIVSHISSKIYHKGYILLLLKQSMQKLPACKSLSEEYALENCCNLSS